MVYFTKIFGLLLLVLISFESSAQQTQFSLSTDISLQRSFKKDQRYWALGQTVHAHFHFNQKDGAYAWIAYYSIGEFTNMLAAAAKSPVTTPQQIKYRNQGEMTFKHISLGWKRYLKGTCDTEKKWNVYGYAGFGLILGRITNTHSAFIDTADYLVPVLSGKANFKRLTLDLGLGTEFPVGGDMYIYFEGRALMPTTDYPSKYLFVNKNAPFTGMANLGIRILFH